MAISYTKTNWVDNESPAINAENLNKIESGIETCVTEINNKVEKTTQINKAYGTGQDGSPKLWGIGDISVNYLVNRTTGGNIFLPAVSAITNDNYAASKKYIDDKAANYVPLSGGTMTGDLTLQSGGPYVKLKFTDNSYIMNEANGKLGIQGILRMRSSLIDMNSHEITNVKDPTNAQDAATKKYVDTSSSSSATIDGTGLISYKNSAGTTLFTLQLPIYNGGVS